MSLFGKDFERIFEANAVLVFLVSWCLGLLRCTGSGLWRQLRLK
jgi:hypothetical protein